MRLILLQLILLRLLSHNSRGSGPEQRFQKTLSKHADFVRVFSTQIYPPVQVTSKAFKFC